MKKFTASDYDEYIQFLDDTLTDLMTYQRAATLKDEIDQDLEQIQAHLWDEDPFIQLWACRAASKVIKLPLWYH